MTDEFRHDTPPIPPLPQLPATTEADNPLDLPDSFDPADYDWHPVARRKRRDGWTHARQRAFVEALSDTGSVRDAAEAAGMTRKSCYALRRSPGGGAFAAAWDAAIDEASKQLVDIAFERAVKGVADPVFDRHGACIAVRRRYNDRLLMFLLRAHQPERYRYAHGDLRHAEEGASAPAQPVARAIDMLSPPPPENVAALMPPDELESRMICAELADGELPHWLHDTTGTTDLTPEMVAPDSDKRMRRVRIRDEFDADPEARFEDLEAKSHLI